MLGTAFAFVGAHKRLFAILGIALAALIAVGVIYARGVSAERERQEAARAVAIVEAMKTDAKAHEKAAETRIEDAAEVAELKQELTEAVADVPDSTPDPVAVALGCQRLRNAGHDVSKLSACSGPTQ